MHIGTAGRKGLGSSLLDSLVKGSRALNGWTQSSRGIRDIRKYFAQAKPVVYAVAKLFGAIAKDFLGAGAGGKGLASMFDTIRTKLLPVLASTIGGITKAFGPALLTALTAVATALGSLTTGTGPLTLYLKAITQVAKGITWLTQNVPGREASSPGCSLAVRRGGSSSVPPATRSAKVHDRVQGLQTVACRRSRDDRCGEDGRRGR